MDGIRTIHNILGERILPVVIIAVAIWFAVAWKDGPPHPAARLFPFLIYLQFALGLIYFVYNIVAKGTAGTYFSFPFILHPILGLITAGLAHLSVKPGPLPRKLGRWAPISVLGVILVTVIGGTLLAKSIGG